MANLNPFVRYPQFVSSDTRSKRDWVMVTSESLYARHQSFLPRQRIEGRSVLDIGCAVGATGLWCLLNGASSYTGLEPQKHLSDLANQNLESTHLMGWTIEHSTLEASAVKQYDIVVAFGVVYHTTDILGVLTDITRRAKDLVLIDSLHPGFTVDAPYIQLLYQQKINCGHAEASYSGLGARPNKHALDLLMAQLGFGDPAELDCIKIHDSHDPYNDAVNDNGTPARFCRMYNKIDWRLETVGENVVNDNQQALTAFPTRTENMRRKVV